jgi:hypothetical protein
MVIPVINIQPFLEEFVDESELKLITRLTVEKTTNFIVDKITEYAKKELSKTRKSYMKGITTQYTPDGLNSSIILVGKFANMIEEGAPPFDMKQGFANSEKAKRTESNAKKAKGQIIPYTEKGWYLTIPMRLGTPDAIGEDFSDNMPTDIYNFAEKNLNVKSSALAVNEETGAMFTENKFAGLSLEQLAQIDQQYTIPQRNTRSKWTTPPPAPYIHKSPMYQGVIKIDNVYTNSKQSTYMKFRRVSSKSDPLSWLHPGIKAKRYFDKVMGEINIEQIATTFMEEVFNDLGM